jgi:hypothetical protein
MVHCDHLQAIPIDALVHDTVVAVINSVYFQRQEILSLSF